MREPLENYTPVEQAAILRRHLIDRVPVSGLCDGYQLSPTMFDLWQKQFFEDGTSAFERKNGSPESQLRVNHLEVEEFLKGLDIGLVERLDSLTSPTSCSLGYCRPPRRTGLGSCSRQSLPQGARHLFIPRSINDLRKSE